MKNRYDNDILPKTLDDKIANKSPMIPGIKNLNSVGSIPIYRKGPRLNASMDFT